ncbi:MAG TPA: hypothetical protein VMF51_18260 [Nocardioides sp.]|uniref:hypothetical protein n=1 Tax=Nocardioides sp. TaxID=35761 RepID=UPI002CD6FED1|nr:hypothetical protein [Nocardioides sp.]HTW17080.1 hypothetical protein [Nocardioides sp.]
MTARIISADDLCQAAEEILTEQLPELITLLGVTGFKPVTTWQQVPAIEALTSANFPVGAITSPGLVDRPSKSRGKGWTATWRLAVGIYDRGTDHRDTAARSRKWASYVRTVLLQNRTLGGVAKTVTWAGEEYAQLPQKTAARTLGGCAVAFDIEVENVVDLDAGTAWPLVQSTHPHVSVTTPQE